MFNLEQAITEWRQKMTAEGIKAPAVLDELESHLREDIERRMRAGENEERAFAAAAQKIGPANALKNEFRKNGFRPVLDKLMLAIAVLFAAFGVFLTTVTMILCYQRLGERVTGFAALGFILLAIFGWPRVVPFLPVISNTRKRWAIEVACLAAGFGISTFYVSVIVDRLAGPGGIVPAVGFFAILPIAIGFALASAIEQAARRSNAAIHA